MKVVVVGFESCYNRGELREECEYLKGASDYDEMESKVH